MTAFFIAALCGQAVPAPSGLTCEYRADPIGIEAEAPRLGWRSADGQTAWRVRVASTPARLASGEADLWDSGRVEGGRTCGVEYAGARPVHSQRAYWQVKTWTKAGSRCSACRSRSR